MSKVLKCIIYVSKVTTKLSGSLVPTGLLSFYNSARQKNVKLGITGILSYKQGYYFQLIEGESIDVDRLFTKIRSDSRHESLLVIFDSDIPKRTFPNWSMKLLDTSSKRYELLDFLNDHSDKIALLSPAQEKMLKFFYNIDNSNGATNESYNGKFLKLLEWPDFTVVKQSPVIIELCARLTKQACGYQDLLKSGHFGTQQQLDKILKKFDSLGIMEIVSVTAGNVTDNVTSTNVDEAQKSNSFYSKMKGFLGLHKR